MTASQPQLMLRDYKEFDDHEMVITISDKAAGLKGYIAIHNTARGPALGGTRMQVYATEEAAAKDVLNLSRAMSYKCALANLPFGGGKGVIIADNQQDHEAVLTAYAKMVDRLNGWFKTGTDVGVTDAEVAMMARSTKHMLGVVEADRGDLTTAKTAAAGVFASMKAALNELYDDETFTNRVIAIKGVGKLGGELARLTHQAGAKVMVADINDAQTKDLVAEIPEIEVVALADIHKQEVDIYAPCALGAEFTDEVINELACKAVVGGANNQLPDPGAGDKLFAKGIIYAPDYIANAGGLIYVADELESDGFNKDRVMQRTKAIQETLASIFSRSKQENLPTYKVADTIARERMKESHD
ncbi:MAG: Glu/Leu/Phe/Val dehydrogenase dimerization domain-containing protein [Candidatus Saccharimonadales bacterium]